MSKGKNGAYALFKRIPNTDRFESIEKFDDLTLEEAEQHAAVYIKVGSSRNDIRIYKHVQYEHDVKVKAWE